MIHQFDTVTVGSAVRDCMPLRRQGLLCRDHTGHMILQTLYQQCIKNKVAFNAYANTGDGPARNPVGGYGVLSISPDGDHGLWRPDFRGRPG